jgi:hypothetical protein
MRSVTIQNTDLDSWEQQAIEALIAQMQDPQQALEDVKLEDEANCEISAGYLQAHQIGRALSDPTGFFQHQRLRSLVMRELRQILAECDLGIGLKAAQIVGKELLIERLISPTSDIQDRLMSILAEDLTSAEDIPLSLTAQESLREVIKTVLLPADWEAISSAAATALQQHLRTRFELPQMA